MGSRLRIQARSRRVQGLRLGPGAECSCSGLPLRIVWMVQSSRSLGIFMMVWGVGCSRLYAASCSGFGR